MYDVLSLEEQKTYEEVIVLHANEDTSAQEFADDDGLPSEYSCEETPPQEPTIVDNEPQGGSEHSANQ